LFSRIAPTPLINGPGPGEFVQLFRPEALRGQDRLHGDVVLVPSVSWLVIGSFLLATLLVSAAFLATARYARTIPVTGILADRGDASPSDRSEESTGAPATSLVARLQAPPSGARYVQPGQQIRIEIDAYPQQSNGTVTATVDHISADTSLVQATLDDEAVEAFGRDRPLRAGMPIRTRIATRSRSLAEWLFDRFDETLSR
jgi:multidrug efflux pump subunit AcrA (membrane-fusion protein)